MSHEWSKLAGHPNTTTPCHGVMPPSPLHTRVWQQQPKMLNRNHGPTLLGASSTPSPAPSWHLGSQFVLRGIWRSKNAGIACSPPQTAQEKHNCKFDVVDHSCSAQLLFSKGKQKLLPIWPWKQKSNNCKLKLGMPDHFQHMINHPKLQFSF